MKSKYIYIIISVALFTGSIYVSLANNNKYINTLNEEEKEMRKKVVKERSIIYLIANICALLLVALLIYQKVNLKNKINNVWMYTAVFFVTQYFVYMLIPKKHWMLQSVQTNQDAVDWLEKYKMMSRNYHIGMLIGIVAVGIFAYGYFEDEDTDYIIYNVSTNSIFA